MYDLVIRGGLVVDGSGGAPSQADVAIVGDTIAGIERNVGRGHREIDAEGQVVTPGFIDGHTHMDAQVMWDTAGSCSCYHGITTVVMGNCGFTVAPVRPGRQDLVVRNLERAEDMPSEALAAGIHWTWETFPQYLDAVDARPKGINYSGYVGHSAIRTWAMGDRAFEEPATQEDLAVMETVLRQALGAGAVGLSTTRNDAHATSDDRPVASRLASWDEVCRLVAVVGEVGALFELTRERLALDDDEHDSGARLRDLAAASGATVTFGAMRLEALELIDSINQSGGRAFGQCHSRGIMGLATFEGELPFDQLPIWRDVRSLDREAQRRALMDPTIRNRLIEIGTRGSYPETRGAEHPPPDFESMLLYDSPLPPYRTVAEVARERGVDPVEAIIDIALESDFHQLFMQPLVPVTEPNLLTMLRHPECVMTFSDSGAHVSQISDCSLSTYLLAYWVRERREFSLPEAVQMITSVPAKKWGFARRGLLREGFIADLNVFDPDTIMPNLPSISFDLPADAKRFYQTAEGFRATIVAGTPTLESGEHTGALPGALVRRQYQKVEVP
jgi:N-acyl-D-amino-acid deacylase